METCKYPLVEKALKELFLEIYNKKALEKDKKEFFSSDQVDRFHTRFLLQILLNNCSNSIKIFGTSLCDKIIEDEKCRKVLENFNYPVGIILTNSPNSTSDKIKNYFLNSFCNKSNIKEISSHLKDLSGDVNPEAEFLVLDNISYLFEIGSIPGEKVARGNFNNPKNASYLASKFDEVYNKSS